MRTVYRFVDKDGKDIDRTLFAPYVDIPVAVRSVEFWPADPSSGSEEKLIITYEYLHWLDHPKCTYCSNSVERPGDQCIECRNSR